ncbi:hypothetical protein H8D85_00870 [bacterium]|nr:hypothetical protein [bacterium]
MSIHYIFGGHSFSIPFIKNKKKKGPIRAVDIKDFESPLNTLESSDIKDSSIFSEEVKVKSSVSELAKKLKKSRNK